MEELKVGVFSHRLSVLTVTKNDINRDNVLAPEIVEDLKAGLEQFREIVADLSGEHANPKRHRKPNPHHEDLCI